MNMNNNGKITLTRISRLLGGCGSSVMFIITPLSHIGSVEHYMLVGQILVNPKIS
jgi:hypothetical protein